MTREIKLTQGQVALVSDHRYDELNRYKWHARYDTRAKSFYATRDFCIPGGGWRAISMHRFITGALEGQVVDHKDHNTLNNQDENLRICTHSQNHANSKKPILKETGFRGVRKSGRGWEVRIRIAKKQTRIGLFNTPEEAALAYDKKAVEEFGEFARLNFPTTRGEQID